VTANRGAVRADASAVPRLALADLPAELVSILLPRVERLGYLGEFFQAAGHQPALLTAFHDFSETGKGALGERLTEVVALTVAKAAGNLYELHQHERLSVRLGYGREWITAVERLSPASDDTLTLEERDVQALALVLVQGRGDGARDNVDRVARRYGPEVAVAVLFMVGRYLVHGLIVNALGLAPPVPSIFEDGFDGA
jgi:alkylhydroperoxidase family enzyme